MNSAQKRYHRPWSGSMNDGNWDWPRLAYFDINQVVLELSNRPGADSLSEESVVLGAVLSRPSSRSSMIALKGFLNLLSATGGNLI